MFRLSIKSFTKIFNLGLNSENVSSKQDTYIETQRLRRWPNIEPTWA